MFPPHSVDWTNVSLELAAAPLPIAEFLTLQGSTLQRNSLRNCTEEFLIKSSRNPKKKFKKGARTKVKKGAGHCEDAPASVCSQKTRAKEIHFVEVKDVLSLADPCH